MYFATLAVIASSLERLAIEVRHLQRTEVLEAEEYFSQGQKGSSSMPHKRNPVGSENITGLARVVRSYCLPAMEDVALWHERDISHSSVERMIGPDATVTLDFILQRMTGLIDKLVVYPENMTRNLDRLGGLIHSQRVLIALTQKGVSREDAYAIVQRHAMGVWQDLNKGGPDFLARLKADPEVTKVLKPAELEALFDLEYHLAHVDTIFARVFGVWGQTLGKGPLHVDARRMGSDPMAQGPSSAVQAPPARVTRGLIGERRSDDDARYDDDDDGADGGDHDLIDPLVAEVELPAGRAEDEAADEGADEARDQIAQHPAAAADHHAGKPARDDADHGPDDELLGVHVHGFSPC